MGEPAVRQAVREFMIDTPPPPSPGSSRRTILENLRAEGHHGQAGDVGACRAELVRHGGIPSRGRGSRKKQSPGRIHLRCSMIS